MNWINLVSPIHEFLVLMNTILHIVNQVPRYRQTSTAMCCLYATYFETEILINIVVVVAYLDDKISHIAASKNVSTITSVQLVRSALVRYQLCCVLQCSSMALLFSER